jgi:hypothetical protein
MHIFITTIREQVSDKQQAQVMSLITAFKIIGTYT